MTEIEQAERDRLKAENSYLLARLCELEAKLNSNLATLAQVLAQLTKMVAPVRVPKLLTPEEVATILSVTPAAVYRWISDGSIPHRRAGRLPRFVLDDVLRWTETDAKQLGRDKKRGRVLPLRRSDPVAANR